MSEAPHRGGEGLQRHWVGAVLGVLSSAHRLLGLDGQLAVAHHRHALEQTRLGHQDIDGVGVDRLEQGVQRGVGLLVRQAHEVRSGLEGLLHRTGVEVHHARTITAPLKFPVPFQTTLISILLPLSDRLLEPVVSRCTARGTTMTSSETTAGPTVTSRLAPTVVTVRVTL